MEYKIEYSEESREDIKKLKRNEPRLIKKLHKLIDELIDHPTTGTGKPEPLRGDRAGQWSRRISDKHRLVYEIHDDVVLVLVLSAYGHYGDK